MTDVLIVGDTRSAALRHEVQIGLPHLAGYAEHDGRRYVFVGRLEENRLREVGGLEVLTLESLGLIEALREGRTMYGATLVAIAAGCERIGLREAVTPGDFPLFAAESLSAVGITLRSDAKAFEDRRRAKKDWELAGLRRGAAAAEAALLAMRERIRAPEPTDTEEVRAIARRVFADHRCIEHEVGTIVAPGPQGAEPHREGDGPIDSGVPIILDIFPRDLASGCWGDMTRTLCKGEPPERLRRYHAEVREAQRGAREAVRPGISAKDLHRVAAQYLADKGHPTRLDKAPDEMPEEGFVHSLGHGVGIDINEAPKLDEGVEDPLVVGDVITIEPGVYYRDFGGVRIEDMVLVTADGHEVLTSAPYHLEA